jgi:hypothetical protein
MQLPSTSPGRRDFERSGKRSCQTMRVNKTAMTTQKSVANTDAIGEVWKPSSADAAMNQNSNAGKM